jgi:hypothetical protein
MNNYENEALYDSQHGGSFFRRFAKGRDSTANRATTNHYPHPDQKNIFPLNFFLPQTTQQKSPLVLVSSHNTRSITGTRPVFFWYCFPGRTSPILIGLSDTANPRRRKRDYGEKRK